MRPALLVRRIELRGGVEEPVSAGSFRAIGRCGWQRVQARRRFDQTVVQVKTMLIGSMLLLFAAGWAMTQHPRTPAASPPVVLARATIH